jgi:hypothetical protein
MTNLADDHQPIDIAPAMRHTFNLWLAIAILIAAIGAAVYVAFFWRPGPALLGPEARGRDDVRSLHGGASAITLPAFDDSDEMVRTLVCRVSASPTINNGLSPTT